MIYRWSGKAIICFFWFLDNIRAVGFVMCIKVRNSRGHLDGVWLALPGSTGESKLAGNFLGGSWEEVVKIPLQELVQF